jgi:hypothetical protein
MDDDPDMDRYEMELRARSRRHQSIAAAVGFCGTALLLLSIFVADIAIDAMYHKAWIDFWKGR